MFFYDYNGNSSKMIMLVRLPLRCGAIDFYFLYLKVIFCVILANWLYGFHVL